MTLLYIAVALVILVFVGMAYQHLWIATARREGRYPQKGAVTIADVERLAKSGEKALATRAYRELQGVGLKEAKQAVEAIVAGS